MLCKFDPEKMRKLPTAFKENGGTITAGNASSMRLVFYYKEYVQTSMLPLPVVCLEVKLFLFLQ